MYQSLNFGVINIRNLSFERAAKLTSMFGFPSMEFINLQEAMELGIEKATRILDENSIFISNLGLPFHPIRVSDEEYDAAMEKFEEQVAFAQALGVCRSTAYLSNGGNLPYQENFAFHVSRLKPIAEILASHNMRFGLEHLGVQANLARFEHKFILTAEEMLTLCAACGENVGLLLDCWHWYMSANNNDLFDNIANQNRIVSVHVNDAPLGVDRATSSDFPRGLPGETGIIDIEFFMKGLKKLNYTGPVTPEPFSNLLTEMTSPYEILSMAKQQMDIIWRHI